MFLSLACEVGSDRFGWVWLIKKDSGRGSVE